MKSFLIFLLLSVAPLLCADEPSFVESAKPKVQLLLQTNFSCPQGASPTACHSFQELNDAGDSDFLTFFAPIFVDNQVAMGSVYVIFDSDSDAFFVVSAIGYSEKDRLKFLVNYGVYQHGFLKKSEYGDVTVLKDHPVIFTSDGATVMFDSSELRVTDSYKNTENKVVTFSAQVLKSTLRTSLYWHINGRVIEQTDNKAIRYSSTDEAAAAVTNTANQQQLEQTFSRDRVWYGDGSHPYMVG
jgi:hypothetical protein